MENQEIEMMVNLLKSMPADEQKFVYGVILGVSGNLAGISGKPPRNRNRRKRPHPARETADSVAVVRSSQP